MTGLSPSPVSSPGRARRGIVPPYEISGPPEAPVIVVLGGISATRHATATAADPSPGWWEGVVGAGRAIDTARYRVLGIDYLDGGRRPDGRPRHSITTGDQADALGNVLDALAIDRVHAVVGASYGGMVGLSFAARYGDRLDRLIAVCAPHESHPMSTALRTIQRRMVQLGLETGQVTAALSIARGLAMTTYRSAREFGMRFTAGAVSHWPADDRDPDFAAAVCAHGTAGSGEEAEEPRFEPGRYLAHCGDRFAAAFPPERFLALSLSSDLHRVNPEDIHVPSLIVAADEDALVPIEQLEALAARLSGPSRLVRLRSNCGHDAFLTEPARISRLLAIALSRGFVS